MIRRRTRKALVYWSTEDLIAMIYLIAGKLDFRLTYLK
jgi:hypothetical protein